MKQSTPTTKKILGLYWQHAWKYPKLVIGLAATIPATLLIHQFLPPLITAVVLDKLSRGDFIDGDLWHSFGRELLLFALLIILGGVVMWRIVIILIWKLEARVIRDIQLRVFNHLTTLGADFHANTFGGSLVSQTNKLTSSYVRIADTTVFQMYTLVLALVFTTVILLPRAPLFVGILWAIAIAFMISAVFATQKVRELRAIEAKSQNKVTGYLADMLTNVMAVKSFSAAKFENARFESAAEDSSQKTLDVMRAATKKDVYFSSVTSILAVISFVMAAASVVMFDSNIATVFLVLSYTSNIGQRLWDFSQSTLRTYNRALGDARDAVITLHTDPTVRDPKKPEKAHITRGSIDIRNVWFGHDKADKPLFNELNIRIKPGEKIGLVGHSGSGKSSLTKLLLRFSDIDKGDILIDGQNIAHITQDELRQHIAYVPQEPLLFHRSISENIAYGRPDASQQEIEAIAKSSNAHEFIASMSDGYDTLVGERGVKLSGGQRQRVAIARAMLKNAPILVLDEATSALDSESEVLIQEALWKLMEGRTAIVIAHRLSTIQKMDRIIVLDQGKIVEEGSHKELIQAQGTYAKLWNHQSGGFIEE